MRAKKSSKNLLRISGLALVFMLAVALLVSAISFTRVGAGENQTSFAAVTKEPSIKELAIDASGWKWNVSFKEDADGNIAVFSYRPSTYKNYFAWIGGVYKDMSGRELTDTYASIAPRASGSVRERLFAYYKLPDVLTTLGATIEVSANLDSAVKFTRMKEKSTFISVASSIKKIEENEDTDKLTAEQIVDATYNLGTTWKVTADRQYLLVYAGGQEDRGAFEGSEKIEISGLEITIKVKSVDNPSLFTPVTAAWDGTTKPDIAISDTIANISNLYTTNNNIVGNLDWALNGEDVLDPTFNKLTSIRTDGTQSKRFSFLLFDKFFGLKEADIQGFDILQAYRGTGAITDGKAKTYARKDYKSEQLKTLRYPTGLESITVQPFAFDNNDPATGSFRGLYVTVKYDGKDNGLLPIETETVYRVNYKNSINLSGKTLSIDCDGIDYTPPAALNEVALITESVFNNNVTYFYTNTIEFKPILENDDTRGDVKYFYTLYKIVDGKYVEIEGQINKAINNPGSDIFTLSGLKKGEYAIQFKAIDTVGQFYANASDEQKAAFNDVQNGWENYTVYSDYHHFTIDDTKSLPKKWEKSINLENGGAYNGGWTNQNVVIEFNTLSSIKDITYQISYRNLKNGVFVGEQTAWVSIKDKIIDNKYTIGYDETSREGYERIYYLQAIYTSSNITYPVSVHVKYDNYGGYKPEIARLLDFSTDAYADLLPLLVSLNYKQVGKDGKDVYVSEFLGSPMTLYYEITRDGVVGAAKELSLDTNAVYMDLFEGRNVAGLTQIQVRFWLEDEAGNKNDQTTYNVNLDRAKINVNFHIDKDAPRYFNNTTDVNTSLVSYTLSNKFAGTIPSGKIGITFDAAYDGVNAGKRHVIVSNVLASYVEGSAYTKALIEEYEKVYVNADGEVITPEADGSYVIGTHEIKKARLTIDTKKYRHAPFVYNGTINYAMTDYALGGDSLLVRDKVLGDKVDEWENIQWKGTFQLYSIGVGNWRRASLISIEIAGEFGNNYQITDAGGNASAPIVYIDIQKAKLGKITIIASKVYNGENTILTNSASTIKIEGLQGTDNITLDNGTITLPGKDVGTYFNVNVTDFKLVGARLDFYDTTDVTVEATVTVTPKTISVTVNNVDKPFDNKTAFQIPFGRYEFNGVYDGDDVKLFTSTGNTANINVGTYPDCKVTVSLIGENKDNYILKETEAVVSVTIKPREIGGAKITGIYAVDKNGNYYYIKKITENEVVIYQKNGAGYIAYSKDENGKAKFEYVDVLPAGATEWVLDTFVTGGVCVINGHRFELSQDIVYAIEYYEDTELRNKLDIGAIDFKERQYQPVVVDQNGNKFVINVNIKDGVYDTTSGAYKYTLKIENFGAKSNFQKIAGFNDTETKVVSVLDFSDVKFENKMFNGEGYVDKFSAPYNAKAYTLNVISPSQLNIESEEYFKKGADGVWMPVENAIDAGVYYGKFTVSRLNNEYIIEQTFTIERIGTEIKIKDASVTYDAKYGEDFAEKVQKVDDAFNYYKTTYGMVVGANDIVYEYSYDEDFKTLLGSAPVRQGGGVCYVRVRYKGNENFIGSVSPARKINVNGAKFNLVDITANVGESFNLPTVENLIDKDSVGGNYKEIAKDFVIVYRVSDANYKVVNNAAELGGEGGYPYRVVHKGLIDGGAWKVDSSAESTRYTHAVSADGIIEATISITENELNSVWGGDVNVPDDKVREPNGIGTISGSWTQADSGYKVYFCILDRNNAASRDNFTNGLRQNKEIFGKEYAAGKVYFLSLSEYKNNSFLMNADKQPRLMSPATVTMEVSANGAKLIRNNNGEWTEVNYVDNGDGTVTFETDKLGYFIFAEDYVAPKAKTNTLAIGIGAGVGGAAVLMAIIVVTVVVIKKKRA